MKMYESLFKQHREQNTAHVFAHFYAVRGDYDEPFKIVARQTIDGLDAWFFHQPRFQAKYVQAVPKLRNYLNYTFKRLIDLEQAEPGRYFQESQDGSWMTFNTGLSNQHGADLLATFEKYKPRGDIDQNRAVPDWSLKAASLQTTISTVNGLELHDRILHGTPWIVATLCLTRHIP